jgi:AcrR family transcriptional regulator
MSSDDNPRASAFTEQRRRQLLDVAWQLVREEGTEGLSLGRLAEQAGVTKPVVYDHFETRTGLLVALYQEYDARQTAMLDSALAGGSGCRPGWPGAGDRRRLCELRDEPGREIPGSARRSPEMEASNA